MAKSMRSKKKKRLRTIRREIAEPFYEKKESAKLAAQEAALAAPKVPVKVPMAAEDDDDVAAAAATGSSANMDVEMADGGNSTGGQSNLLKPVGGVGKKKKLKLKKGKKFGKGKGKKFRKRKI